METSQIRVTLIQFHKLNKLAAITIVTALNMGILLEEMLETPTAPIILGVIRLTNQDNKNK